MKKILLMISMLFLICSFSACGNQNDQPEATSAEEAPPTNESGEPYTLEFQSNGDATCTVYIHVNAKNTELLDIEIPEESSEGKVTRIGSFYQYAVPKIMSLSDFEQKVVEPLETYCGVTVEDAKELDFGDPLYTSAFMLRKWLSYFVEVSQDYVQTDEDWQKRLEKFPLAQYVEFVALDPDVTELGLAKLDEVFRAATSLTVQDVLESHTKYNDYIDQYKLDIPYYPTNCSIGIRSLKLPSGVQEVGSRLFAYMPDLEEVDFSASTVLKGIGPEAFRDCPKLKRVLLPEGLEQIEKNAFAACNALTSVTIPSTLQQVGETIFADCSQLTEVTFAEGCTTVWNGLLSGITSLTTVHLPSTLTSIDVSAFDGCTALTNITLPDSLMSIGASAFNGCTALTSITIPEGVQSIEKSCFYGCSSLKTVSFPVSLNNIELWAFNHSALESVLYNGTMEQWKQIKKNVAWNLKTPIYTIHCTDGDITKE